MQRILSVTNLFPSPWCPVRGVFNRSQLEALSRLAEVRVIAPVAWPLELYARLMERVRAPRRRTWAGGTVCHPRIWYTPKMLRAWHGHFYAASIQHAFEQARRDFRPELLYTPWAYPDGWAAVELGRRARLPVVLKVHGSDILRPGASAPRRRLRDALQRADRIIAVSRHLAENLETWGIPASRVDVVYDGVDRKRFRPGDSDAARRRLGLPGETPIILFVGNLVPVKGLEVLVRACERLRRRGTAFRAYLVGDGRRRSRIQNQVSRARLSDQVILVGTRPHDALPDWFRAADVLVLPSYSEGVPCVLLEALATGLPFVASRVGGVPEIAGMGPSVLVAPGDDEALAAALQSQLVEKTNARPVPRMRSHEDAARDLLACFQRVA